MRAGPRGAGIVEEVGAGVTHLKKGDKVVLSWVAQCGECYYCRIQRPNLCLLGEKINASNRMPDGSTRLRKGEQDLNVFVLPLMEKRLLGSWFGTADVHRDMPKLVDLYTQGKLKLDELVTKTYQLDAAFADMQSGVNARGVVLF